MLVMTSWLLLGATARAQAEPDEPEGAIHEEPDGEADRAEPSAATDEAIHEELRAVVRQATAAINAGRYTEVLPLLTEDFEGTTLTQDPVTGRDGVKEYFELWFGPDGYMESMTIEIEADELTDLSDDRSWGLVRGAAHEHYQAKNGDAFDFESRWTTVMVRDADGEWRVRAIHFGTNHLDNPVLWKVRDSMITYGGLGALGLGVLAFGIGFVVGRRRS